jgi:hypothetical protein
MGQDAPNTATVRPVGAGLVSSRRFSAHCLFQQLEPAGGYLDGGGFRLLNLGGRRDGLVVGGQGVTRLHEIHDHLK